MTRHVLQEDPYGCMFAAVAMVLGKTYADLRAKHGDPGTGRSYHWWMEQLALHGWAFQHHYRTVQPDNRIRNPWPLEPWAPLHICSVDAGAGDSSHVVVMLADGTVLDPGTTQPRRLTDYKSVAYIAGLWKVDRACSCG